MPSIVACVGDLCSEGDEFLRLCRKSNQAEADLMLDASVTQHSRWTKRRLVAYTAFFGQSLIVLVAVIQ